MKTKIKIIIISVVALSMLILGLIFAVNTKKESIKYFYDGGYVINNVYDDKKNEVDKIYFDAESSYTKHQNNEYSFTDSDGRKKVLEEDNFIHYNDNSIMALKDGVAIDLDNIDSKLLVYYNIFSESSFKKTTTGYEINNLNEVLNFEKLLFKISDKKYLLAADEIIISFSDSQTVILKNYVEIEYVNENVIKLYNDSVNYQTISSNLYLIIDNIKINLEYKTISKNNIKYLTMADMVINANDNIEVLPVEPIISEPSNNEQNNTENGTNNNGSSTGNGNNQNSNIIDDSISDQLNDLVIPNENVDSSDNFIQPKFIVESMDVTSLGFENLKITLEDESNVLYGNRIVELVDNSTGEVVNTFDEWDEGSLIYTINNYISLKPNKEYTLNVKGQYKIEDTIYDRTFVSKIFRTLDVGLEITEDYVSSDSVSFAIYRKAYSNVKAIKYIIVNSNDEVVAEETALKYNEDSDVVLATKNGLKPNSNYKLMIKEIQYDYDNYSVENHPNLSMSYKLKTLKEKPNVGSINLVGSVNNQSNTISFSIENLQDNNNGIISITYYIYEAESASENIQPKYTLTQDKYQEFSLSIDELGQGGTYYFNASIEFDDNQKTIIYSTPNSNTIGTSSVKYPQVIGFKDESSGSEMIDGTIEITDEDYYIRINGINKYRIILKENSGAQTEINTQTLDVEFLQEQNVKINLPVHFENLKPNTEYIMYVYLESNSVLVYIGYEKTKTSEPAAIDFISTNLTAADITGEMFGFNLKIDQSTDEKSLESVSNLGYVKINLYRCNSSNSCENLTAFSRTIPNTQNQLDEIKNLKEYKEIIIKSSEFSFYASDYYLEENQYYKVTLTAVSSKDYEIPIRIYNSETGEYEKKNDFVLNIIDNSPSVQLKITDVPNSECQNRNDCQNNADLDDDTIIGFDLDIKPIKSTKGALVEKFIYEIYATDTCDENSLLESEILKNELLVSSPSNFTQFVQLSDNLKRGTKYCLRYYSEYSDELGNTKRNPFEYQSIFYKKQPSKLTGYISKYDGKNLTFSISSNDPDSAGKKLKFRYNEESKEVEINSVLEKDIEIQNLSESSQIKILFYENLGNGIEEYSIYEDTLNNVKKHSDNFILVIREQSNGNLYFDLPFNTNYCENYNSGEGSSDDSCKINNNVEDLNLYGIRFENENGKYSYLNFEKKDNYYTLEIPSISFEEYGITKDSNTISIPKMSVIYDSGEIDINDSKMFFINKGSEYYSTEANNFTRINNDQFTLFEKKDDKYNSVVNNKKIELNLTRFSSSAPENYIGQRYNNLLIHLNKAAIESSVELYSNSQKLELNNGKYNLNYNGAIYISNLKKIYKTDGAQISFDFDFHKYDNIDKLKFVLYPIKKDNNYSEVPLEKIFDSNSNDFKIDLDLDSKNYYYYYSIQCVKDNGSEEFVYDENGVEYSSKKITSLIELSISSKNVEYKKNYWYPVNNSVQFDKNFEYSFSVDKDYILKDNEKIKYGVYLKNIVTEEEVSLIDEDDEDYELKENIDKENRFDVNETIYAFDKLDEIEGNFIVIIKPYVILETGEQRDLNEIALNTMSKPVVISNKKPEIGLSLKNSTNLHITFNDNDGILKKCLDYSINSKEKIDKYKNAEDFNYYLKIWKGDNENDILGLAPIGFNNKTLTMDLNNFFNTYGSGYYSFKIEYCTIKDQESSDITKFNIYFNNLNLNIANTPSSNKYTIYMTDPIEEEKDEIKLIKYTVTYTDKSTYTNTFNNRSDNISTTNNFTFTTLKLNSQTTIYTLDLPYPSKSSLTKSITVTLQGENGKVIAQISS